MIQAAKTQETPVQRQFRMRIDTEDAVYPGLKKLKLRGKDLDDLPNAIFQLRELQVLDLSPEREACMDFHLADLPPSVGLLLNLRVLMLDTNSLCCLPPQLCNLACLQQLSLSNNFVCQLPDEISKLTNLTSLHLSSNRFEVFPEVLCSLKQLAHLDLSCNQLSSLPESLSQLQQLHTLLLTYNCIQTLPESIGNLKKLTVLWIGYNRIKRLPKSVAELECLDWGKVFMVASVLEGNPLSAPPVDVCLRGMPAIKEYFKGSQSRR